MVRYDYDFLVIGGGAAGKAGIAYSVRTEEFSSNDRARAECHPQGPIKMVLDRQLRENTVAFLNTRGFNYMSARSSNGLEKITITMVSVISFNMRRVICWKV